MGFCLTCLVGSENAMILRRQWEEAASIITPISPLNTEGILKELISLIPDFIYGYLMVIIFIYIVLVEGYKMSSIFKTILIGFFFGLFTTYLVVVNSNLLPLKISLLTTGWGMLTFFPAFYITLVIFPGIKSIQRNISSKKEETGYL